MAGLSCQFLIRPITTDSTTSGFVDSALRSISMLKPGARAHRCGVTSCARPLRNLHLLRHRPPIKHFDGCIRRAPGPAQLLRDGFSSPERTQ